MFKAVVSYQELSHIIIYWLHLCSVSHTSDLLLRVSVLTQKGWCVKQGPVRKTTTAVILTENLIRGIG